MVFMMSIFEPRHAPVQQVKRELQTCFIGNNICEIGHLFTDAISFSPPKVSRRGQSTHPKGYVFACFLDSASHVVVAVKATDALLASWDALIGGPPVSLTISQSNPKAPFRVCASDGGTSSNYTIGMLTVDDVNALKAHATSHFVSTHTGKTLPQWCNNFIPAI